MKANVSAVATAILFFSANSAAAHTTGVEHTIHSTSFIVAGLVLLLLMAGVAIFRCR